MLKQIRGIFVVAVLVGLTLATDQNPVSGQDPMSPFWKNGLGFSTADGKTKINLGGRLQIDAGFFEEEDGVDVEQDGVEIRRARVALSGLINGNIEFKTQYDFAGGDADFKDAYIGLLNESGSGLPSFFKKIRVGQQYEPFGLETLTSSKYMTFIERSFTTNMSPGRNTGIVAFMQPFGQKVGSLTLGVFKDVNGYGNGQADDEQAVTGRFSLAPLSDKESGILHLGVAFSTRKNPSGTVEYDADSLNHLGQDIIAATTASDQVDLLGLEAAYVHGPFSLQSELVQSSLDTVDVTSWYMQGSYFLTGESRAYKGSSGVFSRVKPTKNYGEDGSGAVELAIRIQEMDLEEMTPGEIAEAVSIGVNWYLNPNSRIMFNIINATPGENSAYGSDVTSYVTRFAVNF